MLEPVTPCRKGASDAFSPYLCASVRAIRPPGVTEHAFAADRNLELSGGLRTRYEGHVEALGAANGRSAPASRRGASARRRRPRSFGAERERRRRSVPQPGVGPRRRGYPGEQAPHLSQPQQGCARLGQLLWGLQLACRNPGRASFSVCTASTRSGSKRRRFRGRRERAPKYRSRPSPSANPDISC